MLMSRSYEVKGQNVNNAMITYQFETIRLDLLRRMSYHKVYLGQDHSKVIWGQVRSAREMDKWLQIKRKSFHLVDFR